jgi:hypothetical protein
MPLAARPVSTSEAPPLLLRVCPLGPWRPALGCRIVYQRVLQGRWRSAPATAVRAAGCRTDACSTRELTTRHHRRRTGGIVHLRQQRGREQGGVGVSGHDQPRGPRAGGARAAACTVCRNTRCRIFSAALLVGMPHPKCVVGPVPQGAAGWGHLGRVKARVLH